MLCHEVRSFVSCLVNGLQKSHLFKVFNVPRNAGNYSADTLIPSSSKESEYGVVGSVSVFLCGFYNRMKVHECIRTEV